MSGGTQDNNSNAKKKSKADNDFDPKKKMDELTSELAKINKEMDGEDSRGRKEERIQGTGIRY